MRIAILATVSVATLLAATAANAQKALPSPNTTTQTNSAVSAVIDQIGGSTDSATITQNDKEVRSDNRDAAVIIQGGFAFSDASSRTNTARVTQSGAGQRALVMQANNSDDRKAGGGSSMTVNQSGANSAAFGYQFGTVNQGSITQTMTGGSSLGDDNNLQKVNGANDTQRGTDAAGTLRKTSVSDAQSQVAGSIGPAAKAYAVGEIVQDRTTKSTATLNQSGQQNRAISVQAYDNGSTATVTQSGRLNDAWIQQQGSLTTGGNNTAIVAQAGTDSGAIISQIDSSGSVAVTTQDKLSNMNSSSIYQTGLIHFADVYQSGMGQKSDVRQSGFASDTALVRQTGGNNNSSIQQGLTNAYASVNQTGYGSTAAITQGAVTTFRGVR